MLKKRISLSENFIFSIPVLAISFLPLLTGNISRIFGGGIYFVIVMALMVFAAVAGELHITGERKPILIAYAIIVVLTLIYGILLQIFDKETALQEAMGFPVHPILYSILINDIPIWTACTLTFLRLGDRDSENVFGVLMVLMLYTVVISIVALSFYPEFARRLAASLSTPKMQRFVKLGGTGYSYIYTLSIIIPFLFVYFKKTRHFLALAVSVLGIIMVFKGAFIIAMVCLVLNILVFLFLNIKNNFVRISLLVLTIGIAITIVLEIEPIGKWLIQFSETVKSEDVGTHILQIGKLFAYNDSTGSSLDRFELYFQAIKNISAYPITGYLWFGTALCGHSAVMDLWGAIGFLAPVLYVFMLVLIYRYVKRLTNDKLVLNVTLSALFTFFIVSLLNPVFSSPEILLSVLFILPLGVKGICSGRGRVVL